jgi:hypothetical protein
MIAPAVAPADGSTPAAPATRWLVGWAVAAAAALTIFAPVLRAGFVLRLDMMFVPDPALNRHSLGLDGSVPRAVPMDFVVALASRGLPADVVQKLLLLAVPVLGVLGMWRLLRGAGLVGQIAGALAFTWNAYTYERLSLGHWSLLLGVALLPWVVSAVLDVRAGAPRSLRRLLLWIGVACVTTPASGVLAIVVALGVLLPPVPDRPLRQRWHEVGATVGAGVLFTAPWWVPGLLATTRGAADPAGVAAFATRPDTPLGPLGSLLTFGGVWDAAAVPPGRDTWLAALAALLVLVVAAAGLVPTARRWGAAPVAGLGVVAVAGMLVAALASTGPGAALVRRLVVDVPAFGLARDGQKLVAPWLLLVSVCFGFGVARVLQWGPSVASRSVAVMLALLPVALLPALAWGLSGQLRAVEYPPDYAAVQRLLARDDAPGDVVVLPWHLYRAWSWNHRTVTLDPTQRLLDRTVVVRDDLELADRVVAGEDPRVPPVGAALAGGEPLLPTLRRLGIGFVLVDLDTAGGPVAPTALDGLTRVFDGSSLAVYAVPEPGRAPAPRGVPIILLADALAAAVWVGIAVSLAVPGARALLQFSRREEVPR